MARRSFEERVNVWIEDHASIVEVGSRYTVSSSDVARAAKALKRPAADVEAAIAEVGLYEIETDAAREAREQAERVRAAKERKNIARMVNGIMIGTGGLLLLVVGWFVLALMDISGAPQSSGEKACSDLGGRTSIDGNRCVF